jgi:hypothetical protein
MQVAAQQIGPMMNRSLLAGKLANGWLIPCVYRKPYPS